MGTAQVTFYDLSPRHIATSVDLWKDTSGPPGYSTSFPQWSCQKGESLPLASTLFLFYLFIWLSCVLVAACELLVIACELLVATRGI